MDEIDSDDSLFDDEDEEAASVFAAIMAAAGSQHFFNENEITNDQIYVIPEASVIDQLAILPRASSLFKAMTNFSTAEFEGLCTIMCPTVILHSRSTGQSTTSQVSSMMPIGIHLKALCVVMLHL